MLSEKVKFADVYSVRQLRTFKMFHSIAPKKIFRSPYISRSVIGDLKYWRDIPTRKCMNDRFLKYFDETTPYTPNEDKLNKATEIVRQLWLDHYGDNLKVATTMVSFHNLPKATSAGLPFKSGVSKGEVKNKMISLARRQWERIKKGKQLQVLPCRSGARCQLREKGKNKPRLIWAYPGYITIIENQYLTAIKTKPPPNFMGWSINWLDEGRSLTRLVYGDGNTWGSVAQIDFSSFDATVRNPLIYRAFGIVRSLFSFSKIESIMFDQLRYYFINTPICLYNKVEVKERGIPSGSGFTQIIGSIVNMISCTYSSLMGREHQVRHKYSCWLGDDSYLNFREALNKQDFERDYLQHFKTLGLEVSSEKTHYTTRFWTDEDILVWNRRPTVKFLGKEIDVIDLTFHNDLKKLDAQMVLPERTDLSAYETGVRLVGLAWAYGAHYDIYLKILRVYLSLKLRPIYSIYFLYQVSSKPERTKRYVEHFVKSLQYQLNLELDPGDLLSFPKFWTISNRYFGPKYESLRFRSHKISE